MTWSAWLPLALVCLLGAMSPGPSLAVVARHAFRGGVGDGIVCAMAHGVGILLWALLMANGLGVLLTEQPTWFYAVQLAGAGFLLYLGIRVLMSQSSAAVPVEELPGSSPDSSRRSAGLEGFVIALSNPKIAFFFCGAVQSIHRARRDGFRKDPHREHRCGDRYAVVCPGFDTAGTNGRFIETAAPCDLVESVIWRDTHRAGGECGDDIIHAQWTGYWPSLTAASA